MPTVLPKPSSRPRTRPRPPAERPVQPLVARPQTGPPGRTRWKKDDRPTRPTITFRPRTGRVRAARPKGASAEAPEVRREQAEPAQAALLKPNPPGRRRKDSSARPTNLLRPHAGLPERSRLGGPGSHPRCASSRSSAKSASPRPSGPRSASARPGAAKPFRRKGGLSRPFTTSSGKPRAGGARPNNKPGAPAGRSSSAGWKPGNFPRPGAAARPYGPPSRSPASSARSGSSARPSGPRPSGPRPPGSSRPFPPRPRPEGGSDYRPTQAKPYPSSASRAERKTGPGWKPKPGAPTDRSSSAGGSPATAARENPFPAPAPSPGRAASLSQATRADQPVLEPNARVPVPAADPAEKKGK